MKYRNDDQDKVFYVQLGKKCPYIVHRQSLAKQLIEAIYIETAEKLERPLAFRICAQGCHKLCSVPNVNSPFNNYRFVHFVFTDMLKLCMYLLAKNIIMVFCMIFLIVFSIDLSYNRFQQIWQDLRNCNESFKCRLAKLFLIKLHSALQRLVSWGAKNGSFIRNVWDSRVPTSGGLLQHKYLR